MVAQLVGEDMEQLKSARLRLGPANLEPWAVADHVDADQVENPAVVLREPRRAVLPPELVLPCADGDDAVSGPSLHVFLAGVEDDAVQPDGDLRPIGKQANEAPQLRDGQQMPVSRPWRATVQTDLILVDDVEVAPVWAPVV